MMKLQIANEQDRKEAQNRERRRQCELERRSRIFNARNRKIGVSFYLPSSSVVSMGFQPTLFLRRVFCRRRNISLSTLWYRG